MHCPQCGTALPAGPSGALDLCPACLFGAVLAADRELCPYQIVAPLAESAHGTTYLAQRSDSARGLVALKVFPGREDADELLARYERWKPALERVRHVSVARLLDVGLTDQGLVYAASEFVTGWPLSALAEHPAIGREGRVEISRQLSEALDAIHAAGVAHLDLEAPNVRVSTMGGLHVTMLGFGIPLVVDGLEPSPDVDRVALARVSRRLELMSQA